MDVVVVNGEGLVSGGGDGGDNGIVVHITAGV